MVTPIEVIRSGTFVYPLKVRSSHPSLLHHILTTKGMYYFFTHQDLWPFYITVFIPQAIVMLMIYVLMHILVYPWLVSIQVIFHGPVGIFTAWITVLQQSSYLSIFIISIVLMPEIQKITFDAILSKEFAHNLVLQGKLRRIVKVPFTVQIVRFMVVLPRFLIIPFVLIKLILLFLINFIPIIGPIAVILIQAPSRGLQCHNRFFVLKGYDNRQIKAVYKHNTGAYMGFGIVALLLESIPFISIFFMFTNSIGGALWAVDIHSHRTSTGIMKKITGRSICRNHNYKGY